MIWFSVTQKIGNGGTDFLNFDFEIFVEYQAKCRGFEKNEKNAKKKNENINFNFNNIMFFPVVNA